MIDIRQRVKKATLNVESQNILGSRCKVALQVLVKDSTTVASVNKALEDLGRSYSY